VSSDVVDNLYTQKDRVHASGASRAWPFFASVFVILIAATRCRRIYCEFVMKTLLLSLVMLGGCMTFGSRESTPPIVAVLTVNNLRAEQATIYVTHAGYKGRRLGEVNGLASATFVLTELDAPVASDVQFLALSHMNGASILSDPIITMRGASYEWKLAPGRGNDYSSVRYVRAATH